MTEKIYKNGYIYKLYSHINECFYIGSSHMPMKSRIFYHKHQPVNKKVEAWIEDIGADELKYEVLATYKDITKHDLRKYEDIEVRKYLRIDDNCLNCNRVYTTIDERNERKRQTTEQWRVEHKEQCAKRMREYRKNNADKFKIYETRRNKDIRSKQAKQYRENNKEQLAEKRKQKIICPVCNCDVNKAHFARHEKTMKHIESFILL